MEPLYRCPILEEMDAYENPYIDGSTYDPRHYDTLPKMIEHLRDDNHWTDKQVSDWQKVAKPINQ